MSTFEIKQQSLAVMVLKRPKMFTVNGELSEIITLFRGYEIAMDNVNEVLDDSPKIALTWLSEKVDLNYKFVPPADFVSKVSAVSE
ncbi:hypothetical protein SAMN02745181_0025 [Rubritalea squalenifaciens DSM 18772]|uniref:Uncharacterized protein n=1 Tax=Rubritalea squalenifaciens DSM 18772 TaxID=1123071 RepID=A0A1M6AS74_9BACT|nr:hypothetical protein [Rubritalea squalenifaciens]SHI39320.1 hypothetical protein SAMN02745181_0025 [Rubritalea squalenifaciens DSM 18772]